MSHAAFALFCPAVQRAIWEMGWKQLRPIQIEAAHTLLEGKEDLLICAATAGGKTEAAFFPIISRLASGPHTSIRAIYVGPLKALINDQFARLARLCERIDVPVHRWHGDVSASRKEATRQSPGGILLITPESLESNFVNYGSRVPQIYKELEFVVVDELHSFLGNERGMHLQSLLSRLRQATGRRPRMVGLSATIGEPEAGKHFLAPDAPSGVRLVQDPGSGREVRLVIRAVLAKPALETPAVQSTPLILPQTIEQLDAKPPQEWADTPIRGLAACEIEDFSNLPATNNPLGAIADDLVRRFANSTNLVFVNSRKTAEELAVRLRDRAAILKLPRDPFVVHHASIAKPLREEAEEALKNLGNTTAICTSTLEMGMDLGFVSAVAQIDPPWSVSSLVQRLGRSGRKEGDSSIMRLYTIDEHAQSGAQVSDLLNPNLLRGIALVELMKKRWLEPTDSRRLHLSTMTHQVLSHLKQTGGMSARELFNALAVAGPFRSVVASDFALLLRGLATRGLIEQIPSGELILAPQGEFIANGKDFYAAFTGTEMYSVRCDANQIGELPRDMLPPVGQDLLLAGKRWLVEEVDPVRNTIWVLPSKGGKAPAFLGGGGEVHTRVLQEMEAILLGTFYPEYLDPTAKGLLRAARTLSRQLGLDKAELVSADGGVRWFPWVGTRCMRTLAILADLGGFKCEQDRISLKFDSHDKNHCLAILRELANSNFSDEEICSKSARLAVGKFDDYLPEELLAKVCKMELLAMDEAMSALRAASSR